MTRERTDAKDFAVLGGHLEQLIFWEVGRETVDVHVRSVQRPITRPLRQKTITRGLRRKARGERRRQERWRRGDERWSVNMRERLLSRSYVERLAKRFSLVNSWSLLRPSSNVERPLL